MFERIRSIHPLAARAEHSRSRRLKRWHLKQPDGTGKGRTGGGGGRGCHSEGLDLGCVSQRGSCPIIATLILFRISFTVNPKVNILSYHVLEERSIHILSITADPATYLRDFEEREKEGGEGDNV